MAESYPYKKWSMLSVVLVFLFISSCFDSSDSSHDTVTQVPRFETIECSSDLVMGSDTVCGYLIVPENRDDPDSDTIQLHVAILKGRNPDDSSGSSTAESDTGPLVFLTGGPGTSTRSAFEVFEIWYEMGFVDIYRETFGHGRDLIILDQRGTNLSDPDLYCSQELADLRTQAYAMTYREAADLRVANMGACYDRLIEEGIDLDGYDSYENAADVKALRDVLEYDQINLFGASYGTRLSMTIMKEYPEILRSVVIDSILPPEVNPFEKQPEGTMYALNAFFEACKDDYPNTESNFYDIIDTLEADPVAVTTSEGISVEVTAVKFVAYIVAAIRATPYDSSLPKTIQAMAEDKTYQAVAESWVSIVDFFFTSEGGGSYDPSIGMFESITASSDAFFTNKETVFSNIDFYMPNESVREWAQVEFYYWYPSTQGMWDVEPVSTDFQDPVISDIPTLMLVGTLDAGTPPIFSEPSSQYLSNSFFKEILAGHATAYLPCVSQMIDDFVIDPTVEPATLCETEYIWAQ